MLRQSLCFPKLKTEKHIDMELNMNEFNRYEE